MSTKTIAVETSVYERLAQRKLPSESFTKTINRLIDAASRDTCAAAVEASAAIWSDIGSAEEADLMEETLREGRKQTDWNVETLS